MESTTGLSSSSRKSREETSELACANLVALLRSYERKNWEYVRVFAKDFQEDLQASSLPPQIVALFSEGSSAFETLQCALGPDVFSALLREMPEIAALAPELLGKCSKPHCEYCKVKDRPSSLDAISLAT